MSTKSVLAMKQVKSSSTPAIYTVTQYMDRSFWCDCPAFKFSKLPVVLRTCKHTKQLVQGPVYFQK